MDWKKFEGKFIVFDGTDGCGKTTLMQCVEHRCEVDSIIVRDPGSTPLAEKIREILLHDKSLELCVHLQMLLFTTARLSLWESVVAPALRDGKVVFCDRWITSTMVYQGIVGQIGVDKVARLALECGGFRFMFPDCIIVVDVDTEIAIGRMEGGDKFESRPYDYQDCLVNSYREVATMLGCHVVDGNQNPSKVLQDTMEYLERLCEQWNHWKDEGRYTN